MYRSPDEITHKGVKLSDALAAHKRWILNHEDGERMVWGGARLIGARLIGARLTGARLTGARLIGAWMDIADLTDADMTDADMTGAWMTDARLTGADLTGARLTDAWMDGARMEGTRMEGADLSGARMEGVIGNDAEIKSDHSHKWPIAWITSPEGVVTLQIGCQRHELAMWEQSDPAWIDAMHTEATAWWGKHREIVLRMVKDNPSVPYGEKTREGAK